MDRLLRLGGGMPGLGQVTECLLNDNKPSHHILFKPYKLTHRIYVSPIKEAACYVFFINLHSCCFFWTELTNFALSAQGPPTDAPAVDTAEQVYISSLALLKVITGL